MDNINNMKCIECGDIIDETNELHPNLCVDCWRDAVDIQEDTPIGIEMGDGTDNDNDFEDFNQNEVMDYGDE